MNAIEDHAAIPLLSITGLSKRFTGTQALDHVDFDVRPGEIHALLGQNGAGKSTLIKILAGVYGADAGDIRYRDSVIRPGIDPAPIVFIHQDLGLVDTMSVAENVAIGAGYPMRFGAISWRKARDAGRDALALMGSDIDPDERVINLTAAEKSIVAIARALAVKCELLVLDEPTAALPEADVSHLLAALDRLRSAGIGMIYVSHRLDEVFRVADRVTVLRDGLKVRTADVADISPTSLVFDIVGKELDQSFTPSKVLDGEPLLEVEDLMVENVGPVTFSISPGEMLGLVGLRGAGHDDVGRAIFGIINKTGGRMRLSGRELAPKNSSDGMANGLGFISSKRAEESLAASMLMRENLFLNPEITGTGLLRVNGWKREVSRSQELIERFSIIPKDSEVVIATLSGGNQQKVVVARWLAADVKVLILEEPTIGVDVGSKAEIYDLLQRALDAGMAVLLVSSDFEEVERICHRALVFNRGVIGSEVNRKNLTTANLTMLASGQGVLDTKLNTGEENHGRQ